MAERKQGYELKAVRSAILGGQKALQPDYKADRAPAGAPSAAKRPRRKRPRERAAKQRDQSSSSSTSGEEEEKPKPQKGAAKPAKGDQPVSAFPDMEKIDAKKAEKSTTEARTKYRKYCSSFLLDKCTRAKCSFSHHVPTGFKAQMRLWGYKSMGAAAAGVVFD